MFISENLPEAVRMIRGEKVHILQRVPVFGGDINKAYRLELSDGSFLFMKANQKDKIAIFQGEAESLDFIKQTASVRTPEVLAIGTDGDISFLILEYIISGKAGKNSSEELGVGLALMHQYKTTEFVTGGRFGALHDHLLGSGIQLNTPMESWPAFFAECRLRPQFKKAAHYFDRDIQKRAENLIHNIDRFLPEPERPSLLHGI